MAAFIESLRGQQQNRRQRPVFGHYVTLRPAALKIANELNRIYSRLLWGVFNNPYNDKPRRDETLLVRALLREPVLRSRVLEIGAGSGRLMPLIAENSQAVVAVEREVEMLRRLRREARRFKGRVTVLATDATRLAIRARMFSFVFLPENMLGMTMLQRERAAILRSAWRSLQVGGVLACGFRVTPDAGSTVIYQALPYSVHTRTSGVVRIYGVAINWSVKAFLTELALSIGEAPPAVVVEGTTRAAGGRMYHAIVRKLPPQFRRQR